MTGATEFPRWDLDPILPRVGTDGFNAVFTNAIEKVSALTRLFDEHQIGVAHPGSISAQAFEAVFGRFLEVRADVRLIEG